MARMREYAAEHREELNRQGREWHHANRERQNARRRQWHQDHREYAVAKFRQYHADHREEDNQRTRAWHSANRERENTKRLAHYYAHRDEANEKRKMNNQQTRLRVPWKALLRSARERAVRKGVPFELTEMWCISKWTGFCEVTGLPFRLGQRTSGPKFWSPSIDRIEPALGYTEANCRFVLWCINSFKHDATDSDMVSVAKAIVEKMS